MFFSSLKLSFNLIYLSINNCLFFCQRSSFFLILFKSELSLEKSFNYLIFLNVIVSNFKLFSFLIINIIIIILIILIHIIITIFIRIIFTIPFFISFIALFHGSVIPNFTIFFKLISFFILFSTWENLFIKVFIELL